MNPDGSIHVVITPPRTDPVAPVKTALRESARLVCAQIHLHMHVKHRPLAFEAFASLPP